MRLGRSSWNPIVRVVEGGESGTWGSIKVMRDRSFHVTWS